MAEIVGEMKALVNNEDNSDKVEKVQSRMLMLVLMLVLVLVPVLELMPT
jgi:hypothetical protein